MDRAQLDKIARQLWPQLHDVPLWAPEILGRRMWDKVGDPRTCVLYQLYQECETFRGCLATDSDWPSPPGVNYPRGDYYEHALRLMDLVENKEAWQYRLCAHFRELF